MDNIQKENRNEDDSIIRLFENRPYVAIASQDGLFINFHLGEAKSLRIYEPAHPRPKLVDIRTLPGKERHGISRWRDVAALLRDCSSLLVNGIGQAPRAVLMNAGLSVYVVEGFVEKALINIGTGKSIRFMLKPETSPLNNECNNTEGYK